MPKDPRIELFRRYRAGESPLAIADDLCISAAWALEQLGLEDRFGLIKPIRYNHPAEHDDEIRCMMYSYTAEEISQVTGMTLDSVKKAIRRLNPCKIVTHKNLPKILQISRYGEVVGVYISPTDAMRKTNISRSSIGKCLHGQRKIAGGYRWKYEEESHESIRA